jgi:hypothetical protein
MPPAETASNAVANSRQFNHISMRQTGGATDGRSNAGTSQASSPEYPKVAKDKADGDKPDDLDVQTDDFPAMSSSSFVILQDMAMSLRSANKTMWQAKIEDRERHARQLLQAEQNWNRRTQLETKQLYLSQILDLAGKIPSVHAEGETGIGGAVQAYTSDISKKVHDALDSMTEQASRQEENELN